MEILPQLIVNGLIAGSVYALVAIAFNLTFSIGKFFNLALGALVPVGGYGTYALYGMGVPLAASIVSGVALAAAFGGAFEVLVFRRLRARKASSLVLIIASLGIATALQAAIAIFFSSQFQLLPKILDQPLAIGGAAITAFQLMLIGIAGCAALCALVLLRASAFGRAVRAVADDSDVASIVGINVHRIQLIVSAIAGGVMGLVGILVGFDVGIEPAMGFFYFLSGVVGAIVGGIGMIGAGFFGTLLLGVIENGALVFIPGEWKSVISFTVLIAMLLLRPHGLFKK
ncbi:branched-chain amino acid ABC transporter permease [Candidatus Uhrbacteria bacterium]|nr:branched-chain amino acid ABC transporter permease [Candidatus Uhrbacteria bacterium]